MASHIGYHSYPLISSCVQYQMVSSNQGCYSTRHERIFTSAFLILVLDKNLWCRFAYISIVLSLSKFEKNVHI